MKKAGMEAAMATALRRAGIGPEAVSYINAHGTGTVDNDRAEGRAVQRLFGARPPLVSSTKRVFGHTLGAAGAIEADAREGTINILFKWETCGGGL